MENKNAHVLGALMIAEIFCSAISFYYAPAVGIFVCLCLLKNLNDIENEIDLVSVSLLLDLPNFIYTYMYVFMFDVRLDGVSVISVQHAFPSSFTLLCQF